MKNTLKAPTGHRSGSIGRKGISASTCGQGCSISLYILPHGVTRENERQFKRRQVDKTVK